MIITGGPGTGKTTLVKDRIPKKFGFNSINDIQVLSPMQGKILEHKR